MVLRAFSITRGFRTNDGGRDGLKKERISVLGSAPSGSFNSSTV